MSQKVPQTGNEIRQAFVDFFKAKGHTHVESSGLIPANDTVLLTPAGMLQFVPVFLGIEPPPSPPRATTYQKCARVSGKASDLEFVGRTPRHHTFFEMLGNFSFGDYFKKEAIEYAWEFITDVVNIPKEHLIISVFKDDDEAFKLWRDHIKVPENRIVFCDEKDNFWGPPGPTGPCGPCAEIHYDMKAGELSPQTGDEIDLDNDRYLEIWNLVFMEFFQDANGKRSPLENKNIDTGMGLERITMAVQNKANTFETDLLSSVVEALAKLSGVKYGNNTEIDTALKIVCDHARFVTFAMADGITLSNEGRGYIARMILRRAVRYGQKYLSHNEPFMNKLVPELIKLYGDAYPELKKAKDNIPKWMRSEESKFFDTLDRGSKLLDDLIDELKGKKAKEIPGEEVFKLYDTYGFPVELTEDIALENGLKVDHQGFEKHMENQREMARSARKGGAIVDDQVYSEILEEVGATDFLGYDTLDAEATVKALVVDGKKVDEVSGTNVKFEAILDQTPFYAEAGGQVGDRGSFSREDGHHGLTVVVSDTIKVGDLYIHQCEFDNGGNLKVGEKLIAQVEPVYRQRAVVHHSATHLVHAALKKVLGDHIAQAGSHVSPEGARFDFNFDRAMTESEVQRVEYMVNKWIIENTPRVTEVLPIEEAKSSGAVAMFGEKYGDKVRVVTFGENSKEFCGGTHVSALGEIGLVKITSEASIAAGIRRVEFVAGEKAYKMFRQSDTELSRIAMALKIPPQEVSDKIEKLMDDMKAMDKTVKALEEKLALQSLEQLKTELESGSTCIKYLPDLKSDALKVLVERLSDSSSHYVVMLASDYGGKALFVCAVSDDLVKAGIKAGDLVKQAASICGGGGGGRPQFAQAGGKDPSKIENALKTVEESLKGLMSEIKV